MTLQRYVLRWRFELFVGAVSTLVMGIVGSRTPSDVDEGFYVLAAELVAHGRVPYRDFFYPQAPYLPYLLAPLTVFSSSFLLIRLALAACCGATATLVAHGVRRATGAYIPAVAAAILYIVHELTWEWGPSVRAYGVASLLATLAAVMVSTPVRPGLRRSFVVGVLAGVMTGTRFLLAPAAGALIAAVWLRGAGLSRVRAFILATLMIVVVWAPPARQAHLLMWALPLSAAVIALGRDALGRAARGLAALGGAVLSLTPAAGMYFRDTERFIFNNFGFHANRVAADASPDARLPFVHELLALPVAVPTNQGSALGPHSVLLFTLALAGIFSARTRATIAPALTATGVVVAALALVPVMDHYYTPAVPLMALLAGIGMAVATDTQRGFVRRAALPAAVVTAAALIGLPSFDSRWVHGFYNEWDMSDFRPARVDRGAAIVRQVASSHPGPVLALWPGSAIGLATRVVPGTENLFARRATLPDNTPETAARLRVASSSDLWVMINHRVPSVVAVDREVSHEGGDALRRRLEVCGYGVDGELPGTVEVYGRDAQPSVGCR